MDPRFITLFSVFNITFPSDDSLRKIYQSILEGHLKNFSEEIQGCASKITEATLSVYKTIIQGLPPTPSKFHYIFNLRDLSRIYHGLCQITTEKLAHPTCTSTSRGCFEIFGTEHPFCRKTSKKLKRESKYHPLVKNFALCRKKSHNAEKTGRRDPLGFFNIHSVAKHLSQNIYSVATLLRKYKFQPHNAKKNCKGPP